MQVAMKNTQTPSLNCCFKLLEAITVHVTVTCTELCLLFKILGLCETISSLLHEQKARTNKCHFPTFFPFQQHIDNKKHDLIEHRSQNIFQQNLCSTADYKEPVQTANSG